MGGGPSRDKPSVEVPEEFKANAGVGLADKILKAKEVERAKEVRNVKGKKWASSWLNMFKADLLGQVRHSVILGFGLGLGVWFRRWFGGLSTPSNTSCHVLIIRWLPFPLTLASTRSTRFPFVERGSVEVTFTDVEAARG
jgi:hypothetical protein